MRVRFGMGRVMLAIQRRIEGPIRRGRFVEIYCERERQISDKRA